MEVISISGYVAEEKAAIALKYLAPASRSAAGLDNKNVSLTEEAVNVLIRQYCRESGVRNLKKYIDKLYRKAALQVVQFEAERDSAVSGSSSSSNPSSSESSSATSETQKSSSDTTPATNSSNETVISAPSKDETGSAAKDEKKDAEPFVLNITKDNLKDYAGSPVFTSDRMYTTTPVGVVMGLAWTSMGMITSPPSFFYVRQS
jgi:ATP-dependent Lon protease